jgi:hypothetical protein
VPQPQLRDGETETLVKLGASVKEGSSRQKGERSQAWWCTPVIPALGRLRREDGKFQDSLAA